MKSITIALLAFFCYACSNEEKPMSKSNLASIKLDSILIVPKKDTPKVEIVQDTPRLGMTIREYINLMEEPLGDLDTSISTDKVLVYYDNAGGTAGRQDIYTAYVALPYEKLPTILQIFWIKSSYHPTISSLLWLEKKATCLPEDLLYKIGHFDPNDTEYTLKEKKQLASYVKKYKQLKKYAQKVAPKYFADECRSAFEMNVGITQYKNGEWQPLNNSKINKQLHKVIQDYIPFVESYSEINKDIVLINFDDILIEENKELAKLLFGKKIANLDEDIANIKISNKGIVTLAFNKSYKLSFTWRNGKFVWTQLPAQLPPPLASTPCFVSQHHNKYKKYAIRGFIGTDSTTLGEMNIHRPTNKTDYEIGIEKKSWFQYKGNKIYFDGDLFTQTGAHLFTEHAIKLEGRITDSCTVRGTAYEWGKPLPFEWTLTPIQ